MKIGKFLIISFVFSILLTACGSIGSDQEPIQINDAWARPALEGNTAAVYFTLRNNLDNADKLIAVESQVAETSEIHLSSMTDGTMQMAKQDYVDIIPKEINEFKPMSYHVMLINLNQDLNLGDQFEIVLSFEDFGQKQVEVEVKENQ